MSSFPEWPKHPPVDVARPDVDALFGPDSRYTPYSTPAGPQAAPPPEPPPPPKLNTLAVVAFVLAFVVSPAAVVLGVIARGQLRRSGESGRGLATAAIALGCVFTVLGVVGAVLLGTVLLRSVPTLAGPAAAAAPTATAAAPASSYAADALARDLTWQLTRDGNTVRNVTCQQDLPRVLARTVRCAAIYGDGQPVDFVVTVTSVDGDTIGYEWKAEARAITRARLEPKVADLVAAQMGARPLTTSCAGDLAPTVGSQVSCQVNLAGRIAPMIVTTTGAVGGLLSFSITQK
jgi:hypothetical protein